MCPESNLPITTHRAKRISLHRSFAIGLLTIPKAAMRVFESSGVNGQFSGRPGLSERGES